ncbi:MAG: RsbRD N-terminal domain-containing protein [Deltaproteobacteria bacterium]|nr:RsbRD N-terminal domain-containing protein [Deltaproteobacteria bacterium]
MEPERPSFMNLKNLLLQKRSSIIKKWCDIVLRTYPEESQNFLKKQKDRFANPVGQTISEGIASVYDELLQGAEPDNISLFLDNIIRVRAVQEFSPSQAIGFMFGLKEVIREEVGDEALQGELRKEWAALESRIDGLALLCFDIYTECRQKLFDIRVNEVRTQASRLLKMAGLVYEIPETGGDLKEGKVNNG